MRGQIHTEIAERDFTGSRVTIRVHGVYIVFCELRSGKAREVSIIGATDVPRGVRRAALWRAEKEFKRWYELAQQEERRHGVA